MIIDFHTHTFPDKIAAKTIDKLAHVAHSQPFTDGTVSALAASMKQSGVTYSVNLPVMTAAKQVEKVNSSLIEQKEALQSDGIITFGGMHPEYENVREELKRLADNNIKGIKLHPAYQMVDLDDPRMFRIIDCASELGLIVLIHAGVDIGIYDHNYSSVSHILKLIDTVHPEKLVLAHMGNWACWNEVESDLAGAPVWFDTAFALGTITPLPGEESQLYMPSNLSPEDFIRICRKHGTNRIVFGTDCPWENQAGYISRVQALDMTSEEKDRIFYQNAADLLKI